MPPPPPPNSTPHLLDLSPSDHLSDHKALPLPGQKTEDSHSQEQDDGYPDRSTYQTLPDTPGTPPSQDPFAAGVSDENLIPIEADPVAVDDNEHEDVHYDLNALRSEYKRSFVAPSPGLVRRDIGVIRRHTTSTSRGPAPPKPLSPVLSLVGGDIKREKGDYGAYSAAAGLWGRGANICIIRCNTRRCSLAIDCALCCF
ncbi:hypothetical protein K440DRAFT_248813 [Wilcoxina mikolae CBS 423.85]|nr:hypothetical protein K440DRAFT_248813 [Wilcoxina mikolae CBS 423.85]